MAGIDFLTTDVAGYRRAAAALARTGVVAFQPTFVSSRVDAYADPLAVAADEVAAAPAAARSSPASTWRVRSSRRSGRARTTRSTSARRSRAWPRGS